MKAIVTRFTLISILAFGSYAEATATPITFLANLNSANENNASDTSLGTGTAIVTLDQAANTLRVQESFSGLVGGTTASHIHCCEASRGANLNVGVATTTPTFAGFPPGVTSGTYDSGLLDLLALSTYNTTPITGFIDSPFDVTHDVAGAEKALINGLLNGETYLNIHTNAFPTGEIRGTLTAVPEPASLALFGIGLVGVVGIGRRRRRRKKQTA